ncbi:MAG: hypothetical protein ACREDR_20295, partial [Blastocatellia bacterium]
PYGEQWYDAGQPAKWKFTSYERDSESGNDYAVARTYVNRLIGESQRRAVEKVADVLDYGSPNEACFVGATD